MTAKQPIAIGGIPAVLWGPSTGKLFIAVHGAQSHKDDTVIAILAEEALQKGHQVLSFDLPGHGDQRNEPRLCGPQNCVEDLGKIMHYARTITGDISLFGCSLGAYFGMLACKDISLRQALFLSPVVDMRRILHQMMARFDISEQRLKAEKEIVTPASTLYWDDYQYVLKHPVLWDTPTAILYGAQDDLCEFAYVKRFAENTRADFTILENCGHYFHTKEHLAVYRGWLAEKIYS